MIEAKPTWYKGVKYRSRLEARWAVFLEYSLHTVVVEYEPRQFVCPANGWKYTPDFYVRPMCQFSDPAQLPDIQVIRRGFYIEVKPIIPTRDYLEGLNAFTSFMDLPLFLFCGSFYRNQPFEACRMGHNGTQGVSYLNTLLFSDDIAYNTAKDFRFDLPRKGKKK